MSSPSDVALAEVDDSLLVIGTCREQRGCVTRGRVDLFPQPLDPEDRSLALSVGSSHGPTQCQ